MSLPALSPLSLQCMLRCRPSQLPCANETVCTAPCGRAQLPHAWQLAVESACACCLACLVLTSQPAPALRRDLTAAGNCALTGMIVITSGCATLEPWAAALGGVVGGLIVLPSSLFVSHVLKIDDPVDAFVVRRFPIAGPSPCCLLLLTGLHDLPLLS